MEGTPDEGFARRGWAIVRDAADPALVAALIAEHEAAFRGVAAPAGRGPMQLVGRWRGSAALGRWLFDVGIGARAAALAGLGGVRLLQDALLLKVPGRDNAVDWHQDAMYTGFLRGPEAPAWGAAGARRPTGLSIRLALTDEDADTGLRVATGSHELGGLGRFDAFSAALDRDFLGALDEGRRARLLVAEEPVVLRPGDASIHHCDLAHRSGAEVQRPRRTIVLHVFDADAVLAPERVPDALRPNFPVDDCGRLAAEWFPQLA